jgi:hypothetical protein
MLGWKRTSRSVGVGIRCRTPFLGPKQSTKHHEKLPEGLKIPFHSHEAGEDRRVARARSRLTLLL